MTARSSEYCALQTHPWDLLKYGDKEVLTAFTSGSEHLRFETGSKH